MEDSTANVTSDGVPQSIDDAANSTELVEIQKMHLIRLVFLASMSVEMLRGVIGMEQANLLAHLTGYSPDSCLEALNTADAILGLDKPTEEQQAIGEMIYNGTVLIV